MTAEPPELRVPIDELPQRLSWELVPSRPMHIVVTAVEQTRTPELRLTMHVEAGVDREPWLLVYDVPDADLVLLDAYSFVLTVRANIEEWWATRGADDAPDSIEAHRVHRHG